MTPLDLDNERDRARQELQLAGPYTLEMMRGEAELDAFIAASALSAAGKLQAHTARPDEGLWSALTAEARGWASAGELVARIDLAGADVAGEDPHLAFRRLLALCALLETVGLPAAPAAWRFAERQIVRLAHGPPGWDDFGPIAAEIRTSLMLPGGHLVEEMLRTLETLWEDAMIDTILSVALPGWLPWAKQVAPDRAPELEEAANSPPRQRMAAASPDDPVSVPAHVLLAARGTDEVYLVHTEPARIEWVGGDPPQQATLDGAPLRRLDDPVAGQAAWELPRTIPPRAALVLHADPPWEIRP